jgi:hypothetical protein
VSFSALAALLHDFQFGLRICSGLCASAPKTPKLTEFDVHDHPGLRVASRATLLRINPIPPADNPALERWNFGLGEDWTPVAPNIENLQVRYSQGIVESFEDVPSIASDWNDPNSWITGVRVTVSGRSDSTNLQGSTTGVFASEDTHLRKSFTTSMILRNQLAHAQDWSVENDVAGWN